MKKLLFYLTIVLFLGCSNTVSEKEIIKKYKVIVIDSCEYIKYDREGIYVSYGFLAHKGNCKYCKLRNYTNIEK